MVGGLDSYSRFAVHSSACSLDPWLTCVLHKLQVLDGLSNIHRNADGFL